MADNSDIFGKRIGKGKSRIVYPHNENPNWVIKQIMAENPTSNSNQIEWSVWLAVKDTPFADFFCPCVDLTAEGHIIMLRCDPVPKDHKKRITKILDIKLPDTNGLKNYGWLDGRLVLVDYGHTDFALLIDALNQYKISKQHTEDTEKE